MVSFSLRQDQIWRCVGQRRLRRLSAFALVLRAIALPAAAAWADVPQIGVTATTLYDDNIYRVPAYVQNELSHGGSDIGNTIAVAGSYNANLDPALLALQFNVQNTFFVYNSQLNAFEYDFEGDLSVKGARRDITLTLAQARRASTFDDVKIGPRNIETLSVAHLNANFGVPGSLGVLLDVTGTLNKNSNQLTSFGDNGRLEGSAGFGYNSKNLGDLFALEVDYISQHGLHERTIVFNDAPTIFRPDYTQWSAGLRLQWQPSVIWSVKGNAGYAHFKDLSGIGRNQSGFEGDLRVAWSPSPFLTATIHGSRSFSGTEDIYSNGVRIVSLGAGISAQPAEGWSAGLGYTYINRRFAYDFLANDPLALSRTERLSDVSASLGHAAPFRGTITLQVDHRWRTSNLEDYFYVETAGFITLTVPITR